MSFEFANRIEELTNKLTHANKSKTKDSKLEEVKEQLIDLQTYINKQLEATEKRMRKIQSKLKKRTKKASQQSESVSQIWSIQQERVSDVIGGWVEQYEEKRQIALQDLNREKLIYKTKLEEEEEMYQRQAKIVQNKIKTQMRTLEKELGKLDNINNQNYNSVVTELGLYKQEAIKQIYAIKEAKEKQINASQALIKTLKSKTSDRLEQIRQQVQKRKSKTGQIFNILLQID